jgi:hypothetical protein
MIYRVSLKFLPKNPGRRAYIGPKWGVEVINEELVNHKTLKMRCRL